MNNSCINYNFTTQSLSSDQIHHKYSAHYFLHFHNTFSISAPSSSSLHLHCILNHKQLPSAMCLSPPTAEAAPAPLQWAYIVIATLISWLSVRNTKKRLSVSLSSWPSSFSFTATSFPSPLTTISLYPQSLTSSSWISPSILHHHQSLQHCYHIA